MSFGEATGKIILFGEHFVVYGAPAIVLPLKTSLKIWITREKTNNYPQLEPLINIAKSKLRIEDDIYIKQISSSIPVSAGLGSSAALCVALLRAILNEYNIKLSDKDFFSIAQNMENLFHTKSSGVDIYAAMYGTPFIYKKTSNDLNIKPIDINIEGKIGVKIFQRAQSTGEIVEDVAKYRNKYYKITEAFLDAYYDIFNRAIDSLIKNDIEEVGNLMNINQSLLRAIGVSNLAIDREISYILSSGALGAKISGAGRGGAVIAIGNEMKYNFDLIIKLKKDQ